MPEPTYRLEIPADHPNVTIHVSDGKGGYRQLSPEEAVEHNRQAKIEHEAHVKEKGHDCWDFSEHYTFWNGHKEQDAYDCSVCGENLQVG